MFSQFKYSLFLILFFIPIFLIGQNQNNFNPKSSAGEGINAEISSLNIKRDNLLKRKDQLNIALNQNSDEIKRIEELVSYIDYKLIKLHFQLKIEEEYIKNGKTKKDVLSTEEYDKVKEKWHNLNIELNQDVKQSQIELKRSEFERLPKERQKKCFLCLKDIQ